MACNVFSYWMHIFNLLELTLITIPLYYYFFNYYTILNPRRQLVQGVPVRSSGFILYIPLI